MSLPSINAPAGFVPSVAISYGTIDEEARPVSIESPLPVSHTQTVATSVPLFGSASASATFGQFEPQIGREIVLTLSGQWSGDVTLERSVDGGATRMPATLAGRPLVWSQNINEIVWVEPEGSASLYLDVELIDGTLDYRVSQ